MSIKFPEHFPSKEKMIEILHKTIEKSWKNNYSSNNIERWLSNFDGRVFSIDEEQRLALWLLCNYTYYSSEDVNHLCRVLYNKLIHDMISNNYLNLNAFNQDIKNVYFSSIGSASESGGLILYHFRQESMLSVDRFVYPSTVKPNDKNILVFIDDVTISGSTALRHFFKHLEKQKYRKAYYITLMASTEAINTLKEKNIDVVYCSILDERDKCFSEKSMVFNRFRELKDITKHMVEEYGKNIVDSPDKPLGFNDGAYMFGFYYNTPNNSLPIFWSKKEWYPIFERKVKLYNAKDIELSNKFI